MQLISFDCPISGIKTDDNFAASFKSFTMYNEMQVSSELNMVQ